MRNTKSHQVLTPLDLKVLWHIHNMNAQGKPCTMRGVMRAMKYRNINAIAMPIKRLRRSGAITSVPYRGATLVCQVKFIPAASLE